MKEYKVYINSNEIDLVDPNDLDLAITLAIAESNDINVRKKSNTKTLKFPGTATNRKIFGHPEDPNSVVNINQQAKPEIIIEADGEEIFRGFIKVTAATDIDNKIIEYQGVAYGDNADWISRIGNSNINELDYSDQNHTNNIATVNISEIVASGREYVYDLVDRGQFSGQLYDGNKKQSVSIVDRFPALNVYGMLYRIFKSIGYKIDSTFANTAFFNALYFMFTNEELKHPDTFNATLVCNVQTNTLQKVVPGTQTLTSLKLQLKTPSATIISNPASAYNFLTQDYYFCLGKGKYTFKATIVFDFKTFAAYGANDKGQIQFTYKKINRHKSYNSYAAGYDATSQTIYIPLSGTPTTSITFTKTFDLEYADEIYIDGEMFYTQVLGGFGGEYFSVTSYVFECTKVEGSLGMGENQYVDWAYNLPDMAQLDFIKGLKEMFNLVFVADTNTRTIYFEPRDDFYNQSAEDWSALLDNSQPIKGELMGSGLAKQMIYKHKDDSRDGLVKAWNDQNNKIFGAEYVDVLNVFAKDETIEVSNSVFAATWMESCPRIGLGDVTIPKIWSDKSLPSRSQKFERRILYYAGTKTVPNNGYWKMNLQGDIATQNSNPNSTPSAYGEKRTVYPFFYSYDDSAVNSNNVLYSDMHYSSGLFEKYFRNSQKIIDEGRQFSMYLKLTDNHISNLNFRKPKYIERNGNGAYFILDKIDNYKSQDGVSTLCIMTKVIPTKLIKALRYQTGKPLIIYSSNALPLPPISVNPSGSVINAGGFPIITTTRNGNIVQDGGPVVIDDDGEIKYVFFEDDDGKWQQVIMNSD